MGKQADFSQHYCEKHYCKTGSICVQEILAKIATFTSESVSCLMSNFFGTLKLRKFPVVKIFSFIVIVFTLSSHQVYVFGKMLLVKLGDIGSVTPKVPQLCSLCFDLFGRGLLPHSNVNEHYFKCCASFSLPTDMGGLKEQSCGTFGSC